MMNTSLNQTVTDILLEKIDSLRSKVRDEVATSADKENLQFAEEVFALAKNRASVTDNESRTFLGEDLFVERTGAHYPHIRLHGGARADDEPTS